MGGKCCERRLSHPLHDLAEPREDPTAGQSGSDWSGTAARLARTGRGRPAWPRRRRPARSGCLAARLGCAPSRCNRERGGLYRRRPGRNRSGGG
ncbi:hypothetical protein G6F31_021139 [Rhizopus arrhizus]|nr:hypothetical protein G6F31_021139 [Rhizopus arrhizus]